MNHADKIAVFFDVDGTLLPSPSLERRFLVHLLAHKEIGRAQIGGCVLNFARNIVTNPRAAIQANESYFAGVRTKCAEEWAARFASQPPKFFSAGLRCLESHFAQGHGVFLVTGEPAPLAELIGKYLPVPLTIVATQLESCGGAWTGKIRGEHMREAAKRRAILHLAAEHKLNLARSFAYGDSFSDVPMLETVGYPAGVNPSKRLERLAHHRGWPVLRWRATECCPRNNRRGTSEVSQWSEVATIPNTAAHGANA